ncbi:hypothetical protein ANCDUO_07940 [Ancylostoma duodenale]|uniref:Uncharacterized protein n=1 Tax=Ancylostoma duodenale TaxID=51022 RepID=A0A0C2GRQ7_9BILA|nr:hypothetical protein ANCDUO_07940 [Ancylostoma duodenale]
MLLNQPFSAKHLLIRHCEFAAKFGRLPNLDPYGRQLSFIQYYLLDVILAVVSMRQDGPAAKISMEESESLSLLLFRLYTTIFVQSKI